MAARLKPLLPEIVFVGGCTTGLLITDPAASPVRATDDVDVIVEVASYAEYARFSNHWFKPAIKAAAIVELDAFELRVVTTPYFIGTKLEAFRGRGKGDFYASSDLEDIITVLDGRPTAVEEVADSPSELRRYIGKEVGKLLDNPEFVNAIPGHLAGDGISQARSPMVLRTLSSLRGLGPERSSPRRKKKPRP